MGRTYFVLKWGQGLKDMPHTPLSLTFFKEYPRISALTRTVSFYEYLKKFFVDVFALMIGLCAVWFPGIEIAVECGEK